MDHAASLDFGRVDFKRPNFKIPDLDFTDVLKVVRWSNEYPHFEEDAETERVLFWEVRIP